MRRSVTQFVVVVAFISAPVVAQTQLTAIFLGNQAFRISDGETTLFTDFPYESGSYGYMTWDEALLEPTPGSYCLITHEHRDHFAAELVEQLGCIVIGPPSVVAMLKDGEGVVADAAPVTVGRITVIPLDTPHNVEHRSYRVGWDNTSLYFSGDTETTESLRTQEPLEALFLSPWLFDRAVEEGTLPPTAQIVIYHHRAGQRVPACRPCDEEAACTRCLVPVQGQVLALGVD